MYCGDEVAAVVADLGWATTKFGTAGQGWWWLICDVKSG